MDEVKACIAANAEMEELVDKPEAVKSVVRVTGPFTMGGRKSPWKKARTLQLAAHQTRWTAFDGDAAVANAEATSRQDHPAA